MKKQIKKLGMLAGVTLMLAGVLSGCGSKVTADSLIKEAEVNIEKVASFAGDLNMEMGMGMKQDGVSMDMNITMDMDVEATVKPDEYHMDGSMSLSTLGMSMDMEVYGKENEDGTKLMTYTYSEGEWTKSEEDITDEPFAATMLNLNVDDSAMTLEKETEKVNDKDAYVLKTTVSGEEFAESEEAFGAIVSDSLEGMDLSKLKAEVTIKIYKDSRLPASFVMEMTEGLGENATVESDGTEMSLTALKYSINFNEYDSVASIEVPAEAIAAAEATSSDDALLEGLDDETDTTSEVQTDANGNLIISDYEDTKKVTVAVPAGMEVSEYSDATTAMFSTTATDSFAYASAYYIVEKMDDYYTEQDIIDMFKSDVDYYNSAEEYTDVVYGDVKTVQVGDKEGKYVSCSYKYSDTLFEKEYQAWIITDDRYAISCYISDSGDGDYGTLIDEAKIVELLAGVTE